MTIPRGRTVKRKPKWKYRAETVLTAAPNGQWAKKYKGRTYYFGVWEDQDAALESWRERWPVIVRGGDASRVALPIDSARLKPALQDYLAARKADYNTGDLRWPSYRTYRNTCAAILRVIDGNRTILSLRPADFQRLLDDMAHRSPVARQDYVVKVKTIFRWIQDHYGISVAYGPSFRGPPAKAIRKQRNNRDAKLLTPAEIHKLLKVASDEAKAMILLGINGGFGNSDLSELPARAVDLDNAIIDYHRHKTEARRVVPLWPETVAAIRAVYVDRDGPLILDRFGKHMVRRGVNGICRVMEDLRDASEVKATFYCFRYAFATVASEIPDDHARALIMGHVIDGVSENYILRFPVSRLVGITDHVRAWLYKSTSGS